MINAFRPAVLLALAFSAAVPAQDEAFDDAALADEEATEPAPERERLPWEQDLSTIEIEPLRPDAPAPEPEPEATGGRQIEEIVVTAQKTKQALQSVPISVTAVGGDFIRETGAADLADVALYVPNVRVDADDLGSPQIFIRGFGTNAFNPSFEGSVGYVQDEVYYGRPGYFTESMFDIERVEVLRGPQGTLFGKNTIAGVFNVASVEPGGGFRADGRYTAAEHNEHRFEGGVGSDFADWGAGRVSVLWRRGDGELYNQFLDRDEEKMEQKAARLRLRAYPLPNLRTELLALVSDTQANFWPFQIYKLDADTRAYLQSFDADIEDDPYDFTSSADTPGFIEKGSETVALNTQWEVGEIGGLRDFTSTLILAGSKFHIDQLNELDVSPADIGRLDNHEDHEQRSAELRFSGRADGLFGLGTGLEFVAGGFYYDSDYVLDARVLAGKDLGSYLLTSDFRQLAACGLDAGLPDPLNPLLGAILNPLLCSAVTVPGIPIIGDLLSPLIGDDYYQFDYEQAVRSYALFGQMTWNLGERWAITPGLRYTRENKRVHAAGYADCRLVAVRACAMGTLLQSQDYAHRNLRRDESDVSPKLTVQYFVDSGNFYASYAKGFKSGGFNAISFTGEDVEYEPENAQTWELGFKGQFLDRTLRFNATLYATEFDNLQVLAFNGVFFDVSNAATAYSRGFEADFLWLTPFEPLSIMGSVGLLEAKYDEYRDAPAPVRDTDGNLQLNALQDLSGERIAFAPRATATLTPTLDFPLWRWRGRLAADLLYQGDQYTDTDLDPETHVDAYTLVSARFVISHPDEIWSLALGGTNLTDKRVLNQVTDATFFPGSYFVQQASGRQLFAALSFRFQ